MTKEKGGANKKYKVEKISLIRCTSPQRKEVRNDVRKWKMAQGYVITQNVFDSLSLF